MAYGKKYTCDFDSNVTSYTLEIYQKDYAGTVAALTGGANPVIHTWETDEPKAAIKGSSIAMSFINEGNIPLSDFYAVDDEEFKAVLLWHTGGGDITLFDGFIVQDDSSELMADYNHEITLSANDNLGLLKDMPFDQVPFYTLENTFTSQYAEGAAVNFLTLDAVSGATLKVGDRIVITNSNVNGTYHVVDILSGIRYNVMVQEPVIVGASVTTATIAIYSPDLYTFQPLNGFIKNCLLATGLLLDTREFVNINETTQTSTGCFFDQTLIDPQTFNNNTSWDDCYQVLTKILERFNCTLFQARGVWNIVRWDETRYYDYAIPGFVYDSDFAAQPAQALDHSSLIFGGFPKFLIGIAEDSKAETGLLRRITRPFRYTKETFNYKLPVQLLRNFDLQELGTYINTTTEGSGTSLITLKRYEMPWWYVSPGTSNGSYPHDFYILIIYDYEGTEIDRYLVLRNTNIESSPVQAQANDKFTYSFTLRTRTSEPGPITLIYEIKITNGITTKYLQEDGTWTTTRGYNAYILGGISGENTINGKSFEIKGEIPFDGLLTFGLTTVGVSFTDPLYGSGYKDIRLDYRAFINQTTKIIGHTHTSNQATVIKNKNEREIFIDNSPRNAIGGTLFVNSITGAIQTRAVFWNRHTYTESKNLGEITTFENLFLRRIPRTLLEGTFYGLLSGGNHLSPLSVCRYTFFTDLNFIFGRLEIDYRNNSASGTLFEMYKDTEADSALAYYYTFQFLYAAK